MGLFSFLDNFKPVANKEDPKTPNGNCLPEIVMEWVGCSCIRITSTKELSNVVLDLHVGYLKFDNLSGLYGEFCAPAGNYIKGAWIKSGCNFNEDESHPCPEGNGCGWYYTNPNYPGCMTPPPDPDPDDYKEPNKCNTYVLTFGRNCCPGCPKNCAGNK
jgi:hypothetical protein